LLDVGEQAVLASGNKTLHVVVTALHHIAATELAAATWAVIAGSAGDLQVAEATEDLIARTWRHVAQRVAAGDVEAAVRAYDEQADGLRLGLQWLMEGANGPAPGAWNTGWLRSLDRPPQQ
jgi:hypothetical protein